MKLISEYLNLDPRILFIVVVVAILTVFILIVKWLVARDNNLYNDLNIRDENESDEDDSEEDDEEPEERFFRIPIHDLPEDWGETFEIIVDRQTKVQYLCYNDSGITPLIDAEGKPILYKDKYQEPEEFE